MKNIIKYEEHMNESLTEEGHQIIIDNFVKLSTDDNLNDFTLLKKEKLSIFYHNLYFPEIYYSSSHIILSSKKAHNFYKEHAGFENVENYDILKIDKYEIYVVIYDNKDEHVSKIIDEVCYSWLG